LIGIDRDCRGCIHLKLVITSTNLLILITWRVVQIPRDAGGGLTTPSWLFCSTESTCSARTV
jgi:hypothetical protein